MNYLIMNISGIDGDSLVYGALGCTTCSETPYTMEFYVNGDESGGGGGW
jgi:hypothetical protein